MVRMAASSRTRPADLFMSVKLQMDRNQIGSGTASFYSCFFFSTPGGVVEETTFRTGRPFRSLCLRNNTLALVLSEDSGWNITHLPTLPPLDRRHIRHHKSRAVRRPIDGLPKWPTPCLSLRNCRFHPTCQFLQIHATRPRKTRRNLSRKLQRKENIWWVSRLTYCVWVITGLLQTKKKKIY